MTIRSLSQTESMRKTIRTQVCIVGAGMAGLFLARQLTEFGLRMVVVESGTDLPDHSPADLNEIWDEHGRYKWPVTGRVRGLGGSSSVWGGKMIPLAPGDLANRPHIAAPEWPLGYEALVEGLGEIETFFRLDNGSYEEGAPPHSRTGVELPRDDENFTMRWAKWAGFRRGNVWSILRRNLSQHPLVDIWMDATVYGFTTDRLSQRVDAVLCRSQDGSTLTVHADHFVVAAGTIESTRLLLLLDEAHHKRVFDGCDALGRYFQDHLDARVGRLVPSDEASFNRLLGPRYLRLHRRSPHLEVTAKAQAADRVGSAFVHMTADLSQNSTLATVKRIAKRLETRDYRALPNEFRHAAIDPRLFGRFVARRVYHHTLFMPQDVDINLRICIEQAPRRENRISLVSATDRLGIRKAGLTWLPGEIDERTFRACAQRFADFWKRYGLDRICRIEWSSCVSEPGGSILEVAQDYAHPSGTTRMGDNPAQSVVDADLRCHRVANLSVVGASCFPSSGSANPTLTIMLLSWRAARAIGSRLKQPVLVISRPEIAVKGVANA